MWGISLLLQCIITAFCFFWGIDEQHSFLCILRWVFFRLDLYRGIIPILAETRQFYSKVYLKFGARDRNSQQRRKKAFMVVLRDAETLFYFLVHIFPVSRMVYFFLRQRWKWKNIKMPLEFYLIWQNMFLIGESYLMAKQKLFRKSINWTSQIYFYCEEHAFRKKFLQLKECFIIEENKPPIYFTWCPWT